MTVLKDLRPFPPSGFFHLRAEVLQEGKKRLNSQYFLPDTTGLLGERKFADLAFAWSPQGLTAYAQVKKTLEEGDYLELFIDTRDLKTTSVLTRFCHHFLFYPEEVEGTQALEVTRFRGDDKHELAASTLFNVKTVVKKNTYTMDIRIPKEALYGYDPKEFMRLGFCYRFVRKNGEPQHFGVSSHFFTLEKHPALWASLELKG